MRYVGKQNRRCSLQACERVAEFISETSRLYCPLHAQYLVVGQQLLKEENELRAKLMETATEEDQVLEQLDFDAWFEKHYPEEKR